MVPIGGGRFRAGPSTEIRFEGDEPSPSRMIVRTTGDAVTFTRADTVALTPAQLAEYAGNYRNEEVEATHTWKVEKAELVLYVNDRRLGVLEPSYKDGFTRGGSVIDVQRDAKGRITGFVVESGRVRHLRFTRMR
jgi:phenylalanyl-tRNA synthetase alpha subunit